MTPPSDAELERLERDIGPIGSAHSRLLDKLGARWIKGTGFVHKMVVNDFIRLGLVDARNLITNPEVRINRRGLALRSYLERTAAR